jgi:hypothetical protein
MGMFPVVSLDLLLRDDTPSEREAVIARASSLLAEFRKVEEEWRLEYGIAALRSWNIRIMDPPAGSLKAEIYVYSASNELLYSALSPAVLKLFENSSQMVLKIALFQDKKGRNHRGVTIGTLPAILAQDLLTEANIINDVTKNVAPNFKTSALLDPLESLGMAKVLFLSFSQYGAEMGRARRTVANTAAGQNVLRLLAPYGVTARSGWGKRLATRVIGLIF